jgi:hypothetical protein
MTPIEIRSATPGDREAIVALLRDRWGGETIFVHDTVYRPADLPAFVARAAALGLALGPTSEEANRAKAEGWIAIRTRDFLTVRLS